ncbi:uncharacterized protein DMAD_05954 [Drosophila madeirensis]|uniref:F-box domain-containing protein n=1 Tax=Drosophila madeirensis TaxID=30013 RepID=A0AAU9FP15_DROMD
MEASPSKKMKMDNSTNIFDLPLNIVNMIFKKLSDKDKQQFAKVHPLYKTALPDQSVKPLTDIFPYFGTPSVLCPFLKYSKHCATIVLSLVQHRSPHLTSIVVHADDSDLEVVEWVLVRMKYLETLELHILGDDIEKYTQMLHKLPNLYGLKLHAKGMAKGVFPKMKKEIDIYKICLPMKKLRTFGAYGFCINCTQGVTLHSPELKTLIMNGCDISDMPILPSVKEMISSFNTFLPNEE